MGHMALKGFIYIMDNPKETILENKHSKLPTVRKNENTFKIQEILQHYNVSK